jgi:hypothetical protein
MTRHDCVDINFSFILGNLVCNFGEQLLLKLFHAAFVSVGLTLALGRGNPRSTAQVHPRHHCHKAVVPKVKQRWRGLCLFRELISR